MNKETKKQLMEEWLKEFQPPEKTYLRNHDNMLSCPLCGVKAEKIAEWWLAKIDEIID